ncbi:TetR/AcrR family transcriptional regulator [Ilumatobacter sp.]|uniref:TetR/AcrR family transcriptional regulator n=1 Tax=Ilumatobacter sp. TaxID=1967498 RepID=UPI003AF40F36
MIKIVESSNEADTDADRVNPRTRRVREAVLSVAVEVLVEHGAHEVTAARIAEQADVARTTVYRHWPDQRSLLLATIDALTTPHRRTESVGSLAEDVRVALVQLRSRITTHDVRSVFGALATHAAHDEAFSDAQRRFIEQLTQPTRDVLNASQQRGALQADVDCDLEARLLTGPILHQHLAWHDTVTDSVLDLVVRRWLTTHDDP